MDHAMVMREKLSAFVVTYNRASLLETCLRALSFVDELIVVDKSSTDNSAAVAARYADRVEVVPWSPTVEETRAFALSLCRYGWVLFLDDDEILSSETGPYLRNNLAGWDADILAIPLRHYILGMHDERAYYWPEEHHRLFRKGAVEFIPTVHGGVALQSDRVASIPAESGVCIHHLSYQDVASWIERTNRYTSRPDRIQVAGETGNLIRFAHDQIDYWMQRTTDPSCDDYPAAVALLRAVYDMVDRLKAWEAERGLDGAALFRIIQRNLVPATDGREPDAEIRDHDGRGHRQPRGLRTRQVEARQNLPGGEAAEMADLRHSLNDEKHEEMQATLVQLRATEAQLRERSEAARKTTLSLTSTRDELDETIAALAVTHNDLDEARATIDETRAMLDQTQAALDRTLATLDQTQATLDQTRAYLTKVDLEAERLSGSARLFIRQYLPKLRRHLSRRRA
jgi:glycosyltransferase involved in cell wall biosynthesis